MVFIKRLFKIGSKLFTEKTTTNGYCDLSSTMNVFGMHFWHFKLSQPINSEPIDLGNNCVHLLKDLKNNERLNFF